MSKTIQRITLWGGFVGITAGIIFLVMSVINNPNNSGIAPALAKPVTAEDWIKGDSAAALELLEYGDFQCPACRTYFSVLAQLKQDMGPETLKVVFRHFPLSSIHKNAKVAAYAAEAAGKQGKFWEMHDVLFEKQSDWANLGKPEDKFLEYADQLKLDKQQFQNDMKSDAIKAKVDQQYNDGVAMGINSTPTFYLNGKRLPSARSFDEFKSFLTDALPQP